MTSMYKALELLLFGFLKVASPGVKLLVAVARCCVSDPDKEYYSR